MSPVTGKMLPSKHLIPNIVLKQLIASQIHELPPLESRVSAFARVSIYLLDHIFSFCNGRSLGQAQIVCKDFYAVGSESRLWAQLLEAEFRRSYEGQRAREDYICQFLEHAKCAKAVPAPVVSRGLHLVNLG